MSRFRVFSPRSASSPNVIILQSTVNKWSLKIPRIWIKGIRTNIFKVKLSELINTFIGRIIVSCLSGNIRRKAAPTFKSLWCLPLSHVFFFLITAIKYFSFCIYELLGGT
jgi:hypothetical protein